MVILYWFFIRRVTVEFYKVHSDGSGVPLLGSQNQEAGISSGVNKTTNYSYYVMALGLITNANAKH